MWAIETRGLTKHYGETRALDGVDLRIKKGSVYGLLGPNGAGKTTTIRVLATLIKADEGEAHVMGHDVRTQGKEVRKRISLTGQFASVDEELTGRENLILVARLLGLGRGSKARADALLQEFDLADAGNKLVNQYSGGMRRRLDIAASLVVTPEILFLDEPTTGLDPRSRRQVWDLIRTIAKAGTTVLLTTQYLEEADRLADRLAVIDHGRVIAEGTSSELKASVGANALHLRLADKAQVELAQKVLGKHCSTVQVGDEPGRLHATATMADVPAVLKAMQDEGIDISEFSVGAPSLDEVFFALTGEVQA